MQLGAHWCHSKPAHGSPLPQESPSPPVGLGMTLPPGSYGSKGQPEERHCGWGGGTTFSESCLSGTGGRRGPGGGEGRRGGGASLPWRGLSMVNGEEAELEWECAGSSLLPTPHTHVPPALGPGTPIFLSWGSWAPPPRDAVICCRFCSPAPTAQCVHSRSAHVGVLGPGSQTLLGSA